MKKYNNILKGLFGILAILLLAVSCDDMNDIQSKFANMDEQTYLGKVDSVKAYPGFGRAKITWYIGSDPKIEKTIIYWNMRNDSIVKDFTRHTPGIQKDSIIVENLPEGSTMFEFRNVNNRGETSLYTAASVTAWGESFAHGLMARNITSREFDYADTNFKLGFSATSTGDSVVYSEVKYTDLNGLQKNVRIERETNEILLSDFPDGGELQFRTVFFLPQGIDTVYNAFQAINAPVVIFENGEKLTLGNGLQSKYFERDGVSLYEWNSAGDLIVYGVSQEGTFSQSELFPALVPRTSFRDFFFYDDDKFIGVSTGNAVSMHQIIEGTLQYVKTPAGANTFGAGFGHPAYIPAKGFFYSIEGAGILKTWVAYNNATWGSPNGSTVFSGYNNQPFALFKYKVLIGVDADGYLWAQPISPTGILGAKSKIGSGWNKFVKLVAVGDILLGMDENGDFWKFDFDSDHYWVINDPA